MRTLLTGLGGVGALVLMIGMGLSADRMGLPEGCTLDPNSVSGLACNVFMERNETQDLPKIAKLETLKLPWAVRPGATQRPRCDRRVGKQVIWCAPSRYS